MAARKKPDVSPAVLLRQQVFDVDDLREELVDVPEWGVKLLFVSPSFERRMQWISYNASRRDELGEAEQLAVSNLAALVLVAHEPDTRAPLFTMTDIDVLLRKNGRVIERLVAKALQHLALDPENVEAGKGGSSTTPSGSTSSGSPNASEE